VAAPSANGRSGGGAEERLGRPREGRRTALLLLFVCRGGGEEAGSAGDGERPCLFSGRWRWRSEKKLSGLVERRWSSLLLVAAVVGLVAVVCGVYWWRKKDYCWPVRETLLLRRSEEGAVDLALCC